MDAAVWGFIGAIIGGGLAFGGSALGTWATLRVQRKAAQADRQARRRSELIELSANLDELMAAANDVHVAIHKHLSASVGDKSTEPPSESFGRYRPALLAVDRCSSYVDKPIGDQLQALTDKLTTERLSLDVMDADENWEAAWQMFQSLKVAIENPYATRQVPEPRLPGL